MYLLLSQRDIIFIEILKLREKEPHWGDIFRSAGAYLQIHNVLSINIMLRRSKKQNPFNPSNPWAKKSYRFNRHNLLFKSIFKI